MFPIADTGTATASLFGVIPTPAPGLIGIGCHLLSGERYHIGCRHALWVHYKANLTPARVEPATLRMMDLGHLLNREHQLHLPTSHGSDQF